MTGASLAETLQQRFAGRPHVGVVTHFEGWDVPRTGAFACRVLADAGLAVEHAVEEAASRPVFNAVAQVAAGDGMELWLVAGEKPAVGSTLEVRLYHVMDDAALADEFLAELSGRLAQPRIA